MSDRTDDIGITASAPRLTDFGGVYVFRSLLLNDLTAICQPYAHITVMAKHMRMFASLLVHPQTIVSKLFKYL